MPVLTCHIVLDKHLSFVQHINLLITGVVYIILPRMRVVSWKRLTKAEIKVRLGTRLVEGVIESALRRL